MSELNLSKALLDDVQATLVKHDASAEDSVTYAQYLAALLGFVTADITAPEEKLRVLMGQLNEFAEHVFSEELERNKAPAMPAQDAFGVWRPKSA